MSHPSLKYSSYNNEMYLVAIVEAMEIDDCVVIGVEFDLENGAT